jgi:hypothetical protein
MEQNRDGLLSVGDPLWSVQGMHPDSATFVVYGLNHRSLKFRGRDGLLSVGDPLWSGQGMHPDAVIFVGYGLNHHSLKF